MIPTFLRRIAKSVFPKSILERIVVLGVAVIVGWMLIDLMRCELASRRGASDAQSDVDGNDFKYRLRGHAKGWDRDAIEIAKRDFGILVSRTGGCLCGDPDCSYDDGYNRVVVDHFRGKLGFDPVAKAFDLARGNWMKERSSDVATTEANITHSSDDLEPQTTPASSEASSSVAK